jgi:hypothetical protein
MSTTLDAPQARPPEKAEGLATYLKVIYAPGEAFATLARVPTWGWAALIGTILAVVVALVILPASMHYSHIAQEQRFSQMPADQAAAAREFTAKIPSWAYAAIAIVITPIITWFIWLVFSLLFLLAAWIGRGAPTFRGAWVVTVNSYIVYALGSLIGGVILLLRGPESANTAADLYALPSALLFMHAASPKLAAFLYYATNIASLWYYVVAFIALEQVLKLSRVAAIISAVVIGLFFAGLLALPAQ